MPNNSRGRHFGESHPSRPDDHYRHRVGVAFERPARVVPGHPQIKQHCAGTWASRNLAFRIPTVTTSVWAAARPVARPCSAWAITDEEACKHVAWAGALVSTHCGSWWFVSGYLAWKRQQNSRQATRALPRLTRSGTDFGARRALPLRCRRACLPRGAQQPSPVPSIDAVIRTANYRARDSGPRRAATSVGEDRLVAKLSPRGPPRSAGAAAHAHPPCTSLRSCSLLSNR
jgi:hypothetical protein